MMARTARSCQIAWIPSFARILNDSKESAPTVVYAISTTFVSVVSILRPLAGEVRPLVFQSARVKNLPILAVEMSGYLSVSSFSWLFDSTKTMTRVILFIV